MNILLKEKYYVSLLLSKCKFYKFSDLIFQYRLKIDRWEVFIKMTLIETETKYGANLYEFFCLRQNLRIISYVLNLSIFTARSQRNH